MKCHFYTLDLAQVIEHFCDTCHTCTSLRQLPEPLKVQTTEDSPAVVSTFFAADVLIRNKQAILVLRKTSTSYTVASIVPDKKTNSLRETIARLCLDLRPISRPPVTVRVDPAPGFVALKQDPTLKQLGIFLKIGCISKNPVAEKAISELENELLRQIPNGGPVTQYSLALSIARLNSHLWRNSVSAYELWIQ